MWSLPSTLRWGFFVVFPVCARPAGSWALRDCSVSAFYRPLRGLGQHTSTAAPGLYMGSRKSNSLTELEAYIICHWAPRISAVCTPSIRVKTHSAIPSFSVGTGDLNSGYHTCRASTLHTEPSLQSLNCQVFLAPYMFWALNPCQMHTWQTVSFIF